MYHINMKINVLYKIHPHESGPLYQERLKESLPLDISTERKRLSEDVLSSITNREFLAVERNSRLEHITKPSIKADSLNVGSQINFTFTFSGKFNTDLYLRTTIWQVLPQWVEKISANWTEWQRLWVEGEFFNEKWNRLIIREWTDVQVVKVLSNDELRKKNEEIVASVKNIDDTNEKDFITACIKRGIPFEVAKSILGKQSWEKKNNITEIEELLTDFQRIYDYYASDFQVQGTDFKSPQFLAYYINYKNIKGEKSEFSELWITDEILAKYKVSNETRIFGSYGTNKPLSETVKLLWDLNWEESQALAKRVFHSWPAADLLIKLDWWTGTMIKRMIALGYHEGGLLFGRQNQALVVKDWQYRRDETTGLDIWTFQIHWNSRQEAETKYLKCLRAWISLAKEYWIDVKIEDITDPGQKDLITHLWYIISQRGGIQTIYELRDPSLSELQIKQLIGNKIQWWDQNIGNSIVSQMRNTRVDTAFT